MKKSFLTLLSLLALAATTAQAQFNYITTNGTIAIVEFGSEGPNGEPGLVGLFGFWVCRGDMLHRLRASNQIL